MLTHEYLLLNVMYDDATGHLVRKTNSTRRKVGQEIGGVWFSDCGTPYKKAKISGKLYFMHVLVWFYFHGEFPNDQIDHINGDTLDNRIENLRDVNCPENQKNRPLYSNNKSGICGVSWSKTFNKWVAKIKVNGKGITLGYSKDVNDVIKVRKDAEIKYGFHVNHGRNV